MPDYDGDIKLGVSLEPKDIKSAAKSLMDALQKIFKSVSGKDLDTKFKSLQASMSKSADKATQLQQKLSELENTKIPTEEYKEIQSFLDKQISSYSRIQNSMELMTSLNRNSGKSWEKMQFQAEELSNSIAQAKGELQELEESGRAFTSGSETEEYKKLIGQLNDVNNQQTINIAKAEEMLRVMDEAAQAEQSQVDAERQAQEEAQRSQEAELEAQRIAEEAKLNEERLAQAEIQQEQERASTVQQILADEQAAQNNQADSYVGLLGTLDRVRQAFINVALAIKDNIPVAIESARNAIRGAEEDLQANKYVGLLGTLVRVRDAFINVGSAIKENIPTALANVKTRIGEFASSAVANLRNSLSQLGSGKILGKLFSVAKSINNIGHSAKSAHSPVSGLFKKFLMYGLGIRSVYMLIRKLRSAIVEGFKSMAQMNGGINSTNTALSALQSSLSYVKNSWAAAFSPILEFVTPVLVQLMDMLAKAASYISMFLSLLGGKSTYRVAVKGQTDFAKSLGATGSAADKAYDKLAPFDDLEVLGEDKNSGGGGGAGGLGDMFEDIPIDKNEIPEWLKELAELLRDLFDKIMEAVARLRAALRSLWEAIKDSLRQLWEEGVIQAWLESVANLIISIIDILTAAVESFTKAWVQDDNGTNYLRSLFEMLTAINNMLIEINYSIERAFRSDVGVDIFVNILQIFTHINNTIRNLADNFREAWVEAGRGDAIIMSIFTSVDILLTHVNNVTAAIEKWSENIDFGPVLDGILLVLQDIEPIVDDIGTTMEWLWNEILAPLSEWTIEEFIPEAFNIIAAALELMEPIIDKVGEWLAYIWDNFFEPAVGFVGDAIVAFMDDFAEFLRIVSENETVVDILAALAVSLVAVFGGMALFQGLVAILSSPIFWIGLLIVAIVELVTHWDLVKEKTIEVWNKIVEKVQEGAQNLKNKVEEIKTNISNKIQEIKTNIGNKIQEIKSDISEKVEEIKTAFVTKFEEIKTKIQTTVDNIILAISTFIGNVEYWFVTKFGEIKEWFNGIVQEIHDWIQEKVAAIQLIIENIITFVTVTVPEQIELFKQNLFTKVEEIKTNVVTAFTNMKTSIETTVTNILNKIKTTFALIKAEILAKLTAIKTDWDTKWQAIHDKVVELVTEIKTKLGTKWEEIKKDLSDTLDSIKEKWDNIWEGMKKTLQTIVNAIIGIINSMISAVAEGINSIIGAINSFAAIDIPDWVPKVGGQSYSWLNIPTVTAPQIPLLAQGAVIPANHEFLALLGDQRQGTNIEAPLDTIVEAFQEVVGNMQVQNTGYSEMTLDGQTFARLAVPYIISELHRTGYNVTVLEG